MQQRAERAATSFRHPASAQACLSHLFCWMEAVLNAGSSPECRATLIARLVGRGMGVSFLLRVPAAARAFRQKYAAGRLSMPGSTCRAQLQAGKGCF